jgi:hypothetical protein
MSPESRPRTTRQPRRATAANTQGAAAATPAYSERHALATMPRTPIAKAAHAAASHFEAGSGKRIAIGPTR